MLKNLNSQRNMNNSEINKRYCQSCGMPLRFDMEEYLGTNIDGSRSDEFCYYCLKNGKYIVDISISEMVDIWVKYTDKYNEYSGTNYTPQMLRTVLNKRLPTLNRWKQKQETKNIHYQTIRKITTYINNHLFEDIDTKSLISMSMLSEFHFRRVFKSVTGENLATYIQRLRLEQIAHILISTDHTLDQIVRQTNYQTKFGLSKAFRKHFGISTLVYRKKYRQTTTNHKLLQIEPEIRSVYNMNVLFVEVGDSYKNRKKYQFKWDRLSHHMEQNKLELSNSKFVSISLDDPLITPTEKCRFYLGVIIPNNTEIETELNVLQVPKGLYAVFRHTGNYISLHQLYRTIYEEWFPLSSYRPKGTLTFEKYINSPRTTKMSELITEVYIPVEKKG